MRPVTPRPVRLGIVGLGAVAQAVHLPLLARLPDRFAIGAICDLSRSLVDSLGARYGVPASARTTDPTDLLARDDLDAFLILTSGSHAPLAAAALETGRPVFVEKPLAYTLAEADRLAEIARASGGRLQLGYMKLYDPAVVEARRILRPDNGGGPDLRSVEVTVLHPPSGPQLAHARLLPHPADVPAETLERLRHETDELARAAIGEASPAIRRLYTDILLGSLVHDLAVVRSVAGSDPSAIDDADVWPAEAWPPSVAVAGRLAGETRLAIRWHFLPDYPAYREEVRFHWSAGTVELVFPSPYLLHAPTRLTVVGPLGNARREERIESVTEAFDEQLLAFHRLVTAGEPPAAGIPEGRADVVTCQAIARCLLEREGLAPGGEAAAVGLPAGIR